MCARRRTYFLLRAHEKAGKEKDRRMRRPSAPRRACFVDRSRRVAQTLATFKHLRFIFRRYLSYSPPHMATEPNTTETRHARPYGNKDPLDEPPNLAFTLHIAINPCLGRPDD